MKNTVTTLRILYPLWALVGAYSLLVVPSQLVDMENAEATAHLLMQFPLFFRSGIVGSLLTQLLFIIVVLYLYRLFSSIDQKQAALMAIFALVSVPISMVNTLNRVAALNLVEDPERMLFFLDLNQQGIHIAGIFWGLWLFPLGELVRKSGYFRQWVGIALHIGGAGYFIGSFTALLFPNQETVYALFEMLTMGEMVWILYLVILGAKLPKESTVDAI